MARGQQKIQSQQKAQEKQVHGIRCFFDPPGSGSGMEKSPDPGSGMNIPGLIFENYVSDFLVKNH
jgi:hypothetical protein